MLTVLYCFRPPKKDNLFIMTGLKVSLLSQFHTQNFKRAETRATNVPKLP